MMTVSKEGAEGPRRISGSLCLTSFYVSYSVSFAVMGQRAIGDDDCFQKGREGLRSSAVSG